MKSIELKVTKENIAGRDMFFTTYDLLKTAINNPQEGLNVDEMVKRLRLLNKLDEHKELFGTIADTLSDSDLEKHATLNLEDADFSKLKELFSQVKWSIVSKTIVDIHTELSK